MKTKERIINKYASGKKLTRSEASILGHLHTKAFGKKSKTLCYRKEKDKKFHLDVDGSKRYGLQFSTRKAMRNAVKIKYKIREC